MLVVSWHQKVDETGSYTTDTIRDAIIWLRPVAHLEGSKKREI